MKRKLLLTAALFLAMITGIMAQMPQQINYQAVVRDASGQPLPNGTTVSVRFSIHNTEVSGLVVFQEVQQAITNQFGLVTLAIGTVTDLTTVKWGDGPKYLQVEIDPSGGTNFADMGTSQLMSVPYALFAANSGGGVQGATGPQGPMGTEGPAGAQGITGANGTKGPMGIPGPIGLRGATGPIGKIGPQGHQGVTGPQGQVGSQGPQGEIGPQGFQGATGPQGVMGPQGLQGEIGPQGHQGVPGPQGEMGPQGQQGEMGTQGIQGATGPRGFPGIQGVPGVQGPQGAMGPQGPQGDAGLNGMMGPQGPQGFLQNGSAQGNTPYWDGGQWVTSSSNIFNTGGNVGINTSSPNSTLEVNGTLAVDNSAQVNGTFTANNSATINNGATINGNLGLGANNPINTLQVEGNMHMDGNPIYFRQDPGDQYDFIKWDHNYDMIDIAGYNGVNIGYTGSTGSNIISPTLSVNGGSVGVGTTSPQANLDVEGTFKVADGSQQGGYVLTSDANGNATWQPAPVTTYTAGNGIDISNNTINSTWSTNGNDIYNNTGGNVGIGTNNPGAMLEVAGNTIIDGGQLSLNNGNSNTILCVTAGLGLPTYGTRSAGTKMVLWPQIDNANVDYATGINGDTYWFSVPQNNNGYQYSFFGGQTEIMRLTGAGNLGLGTTSPSTLLDVEGTSPVMKIVDGSQSNGYVLTSDASGNATWQPSAIPAYTGGNGIDISNNVINSTWSINGNSIYNNTGNNVGIGTNNPGATLEVGTNNYIQGEQMRSIGWNQHGSGTSNFEIGDGGSNYWRFLLNQYSEFEMNLSGSLGITGGNVGIGTPSPATALDVEGAGPVMKIVDGNQSNGYVLTSDASGNATWQPSAIPAYTGGNGIDISNNVINSTWSINGNSIYNNTGNNVGIGTNNPGATLEVGTNNYIQGEQMRSIGWNQHGSGTSNFEIGDGGSNYWRFLLNQYSEFEMNLSGSLGITGGNVGIGTPSPATALDVEGAGPVMKIVDGNQSNGYVLTSDASGNATWQPSAIPQYMAGNGIDISNNVINSTWSVNGNSIYNNTGNNVGIGTNNPGATLEVGTNNYIQGEQMRSIGYNQHGSGTSNFEIGDGGSNYWRFLLNQYNQFEMNLSNSMGITGGNVGIGTSSPTTTLDVQGTFRMADGSQQYGYVLTSDNSGNASWQAPPTMVAGTGITVEGNTINSNWTVAENGADIYNNNSGNIGIGTISPAATLEINGTLQVDNIANLNDGGYINGYTQINGNLEVNAYTNFFNSTQFYGSAEFQGPTQFFAQADLFGGLLVEGTSVVQNLSTTYSFVPPTMSAGQISDLGSVQQGSIVFDTSTQKLQVYTSSGWVNLN